MSASSAQRELAEDDATDTGLSDGKKRSVCKTAELSRRTVSFGDRSQLRDNAAPQLEGYARRRNVCRAIGLGRKV